MSSRKPTEKDVQRYREALMVMRGMITGDITNLEQDAFGIDGEKAGVDNLADSGSDSYYQEFSLELLQLDESSLREIDEALARIGDDAFGRCEVCGAWISRQRLNAVPYARNCIDCQRAAEQGVG